MNLKEIKFRAILKNRLLNEVIKETVTNSKGKGLVLILDD